MTRAVPKISLERILAERYGDKPLNKLTDYRREYMQKWRDAKKAQRENRSQS